MQLSAKTQAAHFQRNSTFPSRLNVARSSRSRKRVVVSASHNSPFKVQLLHPVKVSDADTRPLLVFLPGTDGTGQAITPQLPSLLAAGWDIRTLYIPPDDRCGWEQLQAQVLYLLAQTLAARPDGPHNVQVTLMAESFGCCLALRLAAAAPHLIRSMVMLNPATCYNQSLNGLSSLVSATNLLGLFPQDLYNTAQAVLLPLLVDIDRVGPEGAAALRSMIFMEPPPDYETAGDAASADDPEQWSGTTLAPDRRRIQATSSSSFSMAGQPARQQPFNRLAASSAVGLGDLFSRSAGSSSSGGNNATGSGVFGPAAAANFRTNLLRTGNLSDRVLRRIDVPTLLISSAKDRMLPSLAEGGRLNRLLPRSRRVMLPDSGHAALLERGLDLATIMRAAGVTARPRHIKHTLTSQQQQQMPPAQPAAAGTQVVRVRLPDSSGKKSRSSMPRIVGVVKDDAVLPGSRKPDGSAPPRPATVLPRNPHVTPAAAASPAAAAAGSSGEVPQFSPGAAAAAGAAMAAASAGTAGGAATAAADVGSSSLAQAAASNGNGTIAGSSSSRAGSPSDSSSSIGGSRAGSPGASSAGQEQQQQKGTSKAAAPGGDKDLAWDEWSQILAPWRDLVSPVLLGQEHLPALVGSNRPLLFVGNHQKMGLYDMPLLAYELYMRGFKVRGLAHPAHWGGPLGKFFEQFGAVPAGPMTAYKLLKGNEQVLLFPGGAKEVNKKVGQEYQLFWKDTPDFVRLAARCGAIIVPFAAVGADDAYDVMMEADELLEVPVIGGLVKAALQRFDPSLNPGEAALPLTRIPGLGLPSAVPIPNLNRLYFKVCAPVDTTQLGLNVKKDAEGWQELYNSIRATVYAGMEELQQVQAADEDRKVGSRISKAFQSWQPAFNITQAPPGSAGQDEEEAATQAVRRGIALQKVSYDSLSSVSSLSSMDLDA